MNKTRWQLHVDQLQGSKDPEKRRALFLGMNAKDGTRICLPYASFSQGHIHIEGKTGAGKSAATLLSLIMQILQGGGFDPESERLPEGSSAGKPPIIIFDLKGDQALFNAVRFAAEASGRQFRFFSTRKGDGCHFFNPFQVFELRNLTPIQIATQFIRAFSLDYGLIYGGLYFTDQNLTVLVDGIKRLLESGRNLNLEELAKVIGNLSSKASQNDGEHILLCLRKLAEYAQINLSTHRRSPAHQINMRRALEQGEVIYIFLEMDNEAPTLRQIAALMLDALVQSAKSIQRSGKRPPFAYVFADEFYHIAGKNFGELLSTSRGWGLHFVLANQHTSQLLTHDASLPSVIDINTTVKQTYSILDADSLERWQRLSGEHLNWKRNFSPEDGVTFSEFRDSNSSEDDASSTNDTQLRSFVYYDDGKRKAPGERVLISDGLFPIFHWQYLYYQSTPIPSVPEFELASDAPPTSSVERPAKTPRGEKAPMHQTRTQPVAQVAPQSPKIDAELDKRIQEVFASIDAEHVAA